MPLLLVYYYGPAGRSNQLLVILVEVRVHGASRGPRVTVRRASWEFHSTYGDPLDLHEGQQVIYLSPLVFIAEQHC